MRGKYWNEKSRAKRSSVKKFFNLGLRCIFIDRNCDFVALWIAMRNRTVHVCVWTVFVCVSLYVILCVCVWGCWLDFHTHKVLPAMREFLRSANYTRYTTTDAHTQVYNTQTPIHTHTTLQLTLLSFANCWLRFEDVWREICSGCPWGILFLKFSNHHHFGIFGKIKWKLSSPFVHIFIICQQKIPQPLRRMSNVL